MRSTRLLQAALLKRAQDFLKTGAWSPTLIEALKRQAIKLPAWAEFAPYLGKGVGATAAGAFKGAEGRKGLLEGLSAAAGVGGTSAALDYAGDDKFNHNPMSTALAGLAGLIPGARRAINLGMPRLVENADAAKRLSLMGIKPATKIQDALLGLSLKLTGQGNSPHGDIYKKPVLQLLKDIKNNRHEMNIGFLTNAESSGTEMHRGFRDANRLLGISTIDAGQVLNPSIFAGLQEGKTPFRTMLGRQGYSRVYGEAPASATMPLSKMLSDDLMDYARKHLRQLRKSEDHTVVMPGLSDVLEVLGLHRKGVKALGIRDAKDWDSATRVTHLAAGSQFKKFKNDELKFLKSGPRPKDPNAVVPVMKSPDTMYDLHTPPSEFDIDIKKHMADLQAPKPAVVAAQ